MPDEPSAWVVNASPVIVLAKVGRLDLLGERPADVLIPDAVVAEILQGPDTDPARLAVEKGWATRVVAGPPPLAVAEWGLGAGESAVVALAAARAGTIAVLDDAEARSCARTLGVPFTGTLGVVFRARRLGRIRSAADVLRALRKAGLFLDDRVVADALRRLAGESWEAHPPQQPGSL